MRSQPRLRLLLTLGLCLLTSLAPACNRAASSQEAVPGPSSTEVPPFSVKVIGKGPPVLLLPGLASPGSVWDTTLAHLQDHYTLHVFTFAGFGGQAPRPGLTLDDVRSSLLGYIAAAKLDRPIVIGHSLGGFMAFWLGATAPDSVGPLVAVDGLPFLPALFDPNATVAGVRPQADQLRASFQRMDHAQFVAGLKSGLERQATGPAHQEQVLAWSAPSDPATVGDAMAELFTTDLRPLCKRILSPVLLLGAVGAVPQAMQADVRASYQAQVASIPHHQVVFLEHARHFIMLDDPQGFFAALDAFLPAAGR